MKDPNKVLMSVSESCCIIVFNERIKRSISIYIKNAITRIMFLNKLEIKQFFYLKYSFVGSISYAVTFMLYYPFIFTISLQIQMVYY